MDFYKVLERYDFDEKYASNLKSIIIKSSTINMMAPENMMDIQIIKRYCQVQRLKY